MIVYSAALALALVVSSPLWLWRMATSGRYRAGLGQRLGRIPEALKQAVSGKRVVWLHAVSVGETLAAERLVAELSAALAPDWVVVVSTTTATGQKIAQERFGSARVFYFPFDFAWIVRRYLRAIHPELLLLMESELWPRLLTECERAKIPVAVVNARISDRSFPRYMRLRIMWKPLMAKVAIFLAQSQESGDRLRAIGAANIQVAGNLKYDLQSVQPTRLMEVVRSQLDGRPVVVAGSTKPAKPLCEEKILALGMERVWATQPEALFVLAPRHPQRFSDVYELLKAHGCDVLRASELNPETKLPCGPKSALLLDTIGDLAAMYQLAGVAFIGGSLAKTGGHNPLEAARFGVPVMMGPSYENFREIVDGMQAVGGIRILGATEDVGEALVDLLTRGAAMGERGRAFFASQAGATQRTIDALLELIR